MPATTALQNTMYDAGGAAMTHVSLHNAFPGESGSNELTGGSYARVAATWNAAATKNLDSSNQPVVNVPAGETVRWIGYWNAISAGTFQAYSPAGGAPQLGFTVDPATDVFTLTSHGYSDTNTVVFFGGTVPGGLTEGVIYFIRDATANTFKVAATEGGAAIDITSVHNFACRISKIVEESFGGAGTYTVTDADLTGVL